MSSSTFLIKSFDLLSVCFQISPCRITTGVLESFLITKPDAAAISSAKAGSVTFKLLPEISDLPFSSIVAGTLFKPIATFTCPNLHGLPNVSVITIPTFTFNFAKI